MYWIDTTPNGDQETIPEGGQVANGNIIITQIERDYLSAVPLGLGNAATDAVTAHSGKAARSAVSYPHYTIL
jgi:hypothetical protein